MFRYDYLDLTHDKQDDEIRKFHLYHNKNFCLDLSQIPMIGKFVRNVFENFFSYFIVSTTPESKRIDLMTFDDNTALVSV